MLNLTDFVASTSQAARRLLLFLRDHRSLADFALWQGSAADPILLSLPERMYKARLIDHWMVRILDVSKALQARGYSRNLNAEIHLKVRDQLLPSNDARWILRIGDGGADVEAGGRGDVLIDVGGLASIYTGHLSAHDLVAAGLLRPSEKCADFDEVLPQLTAVFAGVAPSMADMF